MAKDMDMKEHGGGCMCSMCGGGMWGHHHWGHMLVKLVIVLFIFWAGVQFGELKAIVENSNFGPMMGGWGGYSNVYPVQGTTMGGWSAPEGGAVDVQMMRVSTSTR